MDPYPDVSELEVHDSIQLGDPTWSEPTFQIRRPSCDDQNLMVNLRSNDDNAPNTAVLPYNIYALQALAAWARYILRVSAGTCRSETKPYPTPNARSPTTSCTVYSSVTAYESL